MEECSDSVSKEITNHRVHMTGIAPIADVPCFHCGPSKTENLKWMVRDSKKINKLVSKRKIFKKLTWKMKVVDDENNDDDNDNYDDDNNNNNDNNDNSDILIFTILMKAIVKTIFLKNWISTIFFKQYYDGETRWDSFTLESGIEVVL